MPDDPSKKPGFRKRLKNSYRIVIFNSDTFEEISNYKLSLQNIYILISSVVIILTFLIVLFIVLTPVRRLMPGYGEIGHSEKFMKLNRNLDTIEAILDAHDLYLASFRKMLIADEGEGEFVPSEEELLAEAIGQSILNNKQIKDSDFDTKKPTGNFQRSKVEPLAQLLFLPPVSGLISAKFMPEIKHFGVDILAPSNTPVKAVKDGFVIISGWNLETGNTIGIQHSDNMVSFYKHNSALLKDEGSFVKAGEAIAIIGNTGTLSDGPHLHFELWYNGNPVNPVDYINFE